MKTRALCMIASLVAALAAASCYHVGSLPGAPDDDDTGSGDTDTDTDSETDTASDTDELSGEWCDTVSGLCWQNPPDPDRMNPVMGRFYCQGLVLAGHVGWRLPSISELRTLIRGCPSLETGGECPITDECDFEGEQVWDSSCGGEGAMCPAHEGYYWAPELTDTSWEWPDGHVDVGYVEEHEECDSCRSRYLSSSYFSHNPNHGVACWVDFAYPFVDCCLVIKPNSGVDDHHNGHGRIRCVRTAG
jgi:hypothetical protein